MLPRPDLQAEPGRASGPSRPLRIVHCFRSPVGGIFRHVRDLAESQARAGHEVAILCDRSTGGAHEERLFAKVLPHLSLGLIRVPMDRAITPRDALVMWRTLRHLRALKPDVLHSHGAKGGAYARLIGTLLKGSGRPLARLYCPHGGSLHYDAASAKGRIFFALERTLERMTDRLIFVSAYEADSYRDKVGTPRPPVSLIRNGLRPEEFAPIEPSPGAADFLYIGMMRDLKGPDLFLEALALLRDRHGLTATAHFVGDGDDKPRYRQMIARLGLGERVSVHDAMPAREAFALARCVVVPSRAESMPYLVLEAAAAGMPLIATRVGGIPEIFTGEDDLLVRPDSAEALGAAMAAAMAPGSPLARQAAARRDRMGSDFTVEAMTRAVDQAYRSSL